MASSRHLKGTVFTRVRDLLKSGVLTEKPVWFDVVATFPPVVEADIERQAVPGHVGKIVFRNDGLRRKFSTKFQEEPMSLCETSRVNNITLTDRFIEKCSQFISEGVDEPEAFHQTVMSFEHELTEKLNTSNSQKKTKTRQEKESSRTLYDFLNIKDSETTKD